MVQESRLRFFDEEGALLSKWPGRSKTMLMYASLDSAQESHLRKLLLIHAVGQTCLEVYFGKDGLHFKGIHLDEDARASDLTNLCLANGLKDSWRKSPAYLVWCGRKLHPHDSLRGYFETGSILILVPSTIESVI